MGFLNSFKKIFQENNNNSGQVETVHCEELIRFISFAQKTKPLMGGNYGIKVSYSPPNRSKNEYTAKIYAEFGFYAFDDIYFARESALKANHSELEARMVRHYYNKITEGAGLEQTDWPYGMDAYDFARMVSNSDEFGFTALIPDQYNDDIFTIKINAGFATQNGVLAYKLIEQECLKHFPNLSIRKSFATANGFLFTINI